ncbi:TPA_asm: hypothetical protein AvPV1_gp22 [Archaeoglobus veneficus pleomorphic virus 1]|uniref:PIN domain-containing protein n=1 Tax=Archaeoglobus veneficus pleomorphic virus 1 TaxID=3115750 RepID=A0AAT9JGR7_9VIRU
MEYFVDTCVVVCHASNFGGVEKYGDDCDEFFERDFDRITSKNVKEELKCVEKRRLKLYASIIDVLNKGGDLSEVEADEKVRKHLQAIVEAVENGRIEASVQNFRNIEIFFRNRLYYEFSNFITFINTSQILRGLHLFNRVFFV